MQFNKLNIFIDSGLREAEFRDSKSCHTTSLMAFIKDGNIKSCFSEEVTGGESCGSRSNHSSFDTVNFSNRFILIEIVIVSIFSSDKFKVSYEKRIFIILPGTFESTLMIANISGYKGERVL